MVPAFRKRSFTARVSRERKRRLGLLIASHSLAEIIHPEIGALIE
jgi:hypothetical protein